MLESNDSNHTKGLAPSTQIQLQLYQILIFNWRLPLQWNHKKINKFNYHPNKTKKKKTKTRKPEQMN
jgi:hypothetical protein